MKSALISGHTELVVELLDAGQDVNHPETRPLMSALRYPHLVELLLDRGANVDAPRDWHGNTPLLIAAGSEHTDTVRHLLDHGADLNATNDSGSTPVTVAAQSGHNETVRLLLAQGVATDGLLSAAAAGGLLWFVEERLDAGDPVDGGSPILGAATAGHVDVVRLLIDRGANLEHEEGHFGLVTMAKANKQPEIVEMLIQPAHRTPRPGRNGRTRRTRSTRRCGIHKGQPCSNSSASRPSRRSPNCPTSNTCARKAASGIRRSVTWPRCAG